MAEQAVSLLSWLQAGLVSDDRRPRNTPGLAICRNLRVTDNGLETLETLDVFAAIDTWPNPKLFHGRGETLLVKKATLDIIDTSVGPWTVDVNVDIQPGFHFDYSTQAFPVPAPGITNQADESWHFVDFWGTWMLLNTVTTISKTGHFPDPVESNEVTILTGCNFKDGRSILGGFDPTNYWSDIWRAFLNRLTSLAPGVTLPPEVAALVDLDAGPGSSWVWFSSIGGDDFLNHLFPESNFDFVSGVLPFQHNPQEYQTIGTDIITNGFFSSASDWQFNGAWSFDVDKATHVAGTADYLEQLQADLISPFKKNTWYEIKFDVTLTAGFIHAGFRGGNEVISAPVIGSGVFQFSIFTGDNVDFFIFANSAFSGSVDNVTLKESAINFASDMSITELHTPPLLVDGNLSKAGNLFEADQSAQHSSIENDNQSWYPVSRFERMYNWRFKSANAGETAPESWTIAAETSWDRTDGTILFDVGTNGSAGGTNNIQQIEADQQLTIDDDQWYRLFIKIVSGTYTTGEMHAQVTDVSEDGISHITFTVTSATDNEHIRQRYPDYDYLMADIHVPRDGTHTNTDLNVWSELANAKVLGVSVIPFGQENLVGHKASGINRYQYGPGDARLANFTLDFDSSIAFSEIAPLHHFLNDYDLVSGRRYTVSWEQGFGFKDGNAEVRPILLGSNVRDDGSAFLTGSGYFTKTMTAGTTGSKLQFEIQSEDDPWINRIEIFEEALITQAAIRTEDKRQPIWDLWERNEAGAMPLPSQGTIQHIKALGESFAIVYSTGGITALRHFSHPISVMAPMDIPRLPQHLGLLDRGSIGSGAHRHIFIGTDHKLYELREDLEFTVIGYQHIFEAPVWATGKIEIVYDDKEDEFYISNGTISYGLHNRSLFQHNQIVSSVIFVEGTRAAIADATASPSDWEILTREFSGNDPRLIHILDSVEVSGKFNTPTPNITISIDFKMGLSDAAFVRVASGAMDLRGISRAQITGKLFRIHLTGTDRTEIDNIDDIRYVIRDSGTTALNPLLS